MTRRPLTTTLRALCEPRERVAAGLVALLAGGVVYAVAVGVFPYHSPNHDEGVYLQQAALLLEGQFAMHAGELADAVRPWFFVREGGTLYPKYQPYPAVLYALATATVGEPRVALAAVAAANASLVYLLGATAFDRRIGLLAAVAFATAPMTLLTTAVFLPYAPTTALNLAFAVCYLRALRTGRVGTAALAGGAIGVAFFARPYTAVLFAAPFVVHAGWQVLGALRRHGPTAALGSDEGGPRLPDAIRRNLATAAAGLAFVGLTFAYNAVVTGSALQFPYEAFAPLDGPGFGHREILGHSVAYTPALALEANGYALRYLLVRWGPAGIVGSALALVGLGVAAIDLFRGRSVTGAEHSRVLDGPRTARLLLAGLFVSVPLGNVAFWGNYNVLGTLDDPTDGLVASFGPFYHFDLLAPLAIFAAAGAIALWRSARRLRTDGPAAAGVPGDTLERALDGPRQRVAALDRRRVGSTALAALVLTGLLAGAATAAFVTQPAERNLEHTDDLEQAYQPFETTAFSNAVVFLPTPYGPWLNHPFQALRNDPGLDGDVVYVQERDPAGDFEVVDAYPDRRYYRYTYRGEWTPGPGEPVEPRLEAVERRAGRHLAGETTVGVPANVDHASVRLETDDGERVQYLVDEPDEAIAVEWSLAPDGARLDVPADAPRTEPGPSDPVAIDGHDEAVLLVRLVQPEGATLTYRQEIPIRETEDGVEALWPPEQTVCPLVDDCGRRGTYLPDRPDAHPDGVFFDTSLAVAPEA